MIGLKTKLGLIAICLVGIAGCQTTRSYSSAAVTGSFKNGNFNGHVRQFGCRTDDQLPFNGSVAKGRITGDVGYKGQTSFDMPINADNSFGPQRLFLRMHSSGSEKYHWVSGKISGQNLIIDIESGVPGRSESYCGSNGNTFVPG